MMNLIDETLTALCSEKFWRYGYTDVVPCSDATIHYINKFHVIGKYAGDSKVKPFNLMSKGIGKCYLEKSDALNLKRLKKGYIDSNGYKQKLPRYYSDKIFSIREKEAMAEYMRELSLKKENEGIKECMNSKTNYWKLQTTISEQQRINFIKQLKSKETL